MIIKVLGPGCKNCKKLYDNVQKALSQLYMTHEVVKVEDYAEIAKYKVLRTPAIVIDEEVVTTGRVLAPSQIRAIIESK